MMEEENFIVECECDLNSSIFGEGESFVSKLKVETEKKKSMLFFSNLFSLRFFGFFSFKKNVFSIELIDS